MKRIVFILLTLLVFGGCALESSFSFPKKETLDTNLFGTWVSVKGGDSDNWVTIEPLDEFSYKFTYSDGTATGHTGNFAWHKIMNVIDTRNEKPNSFYGYILKKNKLEVYEVNEALVEKDFNSQEELIAFFEEYAYEANFLVNKEVYKRKK